MSFLSPLRLILLIAPLILIGLYVFMQSRRKQYALRFSSAELLSSVVPKRSAYKRHVPAALFTAAVAVFVLAFAQPATTVRVPTERATLILAIDVSLSMMAEDVDPSRFEAAKVAAQTFIDDLPDTIQLGLVSFSGFAALEVAPTAEHDEVTRALDRLVLAPATATGDAISLGLRTAEGLNLEGQEPIPATIVVLSDGELTAGISEFEAINLAIEAEIPVSTISFGTAFGTVEIEDPNFPELGLVETPVPVAEENLENIADETGGTYFKAETVSELDDIYTDIGSAVGFDEIDREITDWFTGLGLLLLAVVAGLSLTWSQRLP